MVLFVHYVNFFVIKLLLDNDLFRTGYIFVGNTNPLRGINLVLDSAPVSVLRDLGDAEPQTLFRDRYNFTSRVWSASDIHVLLERHTKQMRINGVL